MTINEYKNLSLGEQNEFLKTTTDMVFLNMIINSNGKNFNEVKIILENELVTSKVLDNLYDKYKESNEYMEIFERNIVSNINCPKEIISDVYNQSVENMEDSTKDYKLVKEMIAKNPNTDYDILISSIKDNAKDVALNPNLQNVVIDRLFDEMDNINNIDILDYLSKNENISNDTINKIITKLNYEYEKSTQNNIIRNLLNNPNISEYNIKKIIDVVNNFDFKNQNFNINKYDSIIELSKNPNTSKEVLDYLSKTMSINIILKNIINNPNTSVSTLTHIININTDIYSDVNEKIYKDSKKSFDELNNFFGEIILTNTDIENFNKLSFQKQKSLAIKSNNIKLLDDLSEIFHIKQYVVENENCPKNILEKLSLDENYKVRQQIGLNINTPIEVLVELSKDKHYDVRLAIVRNINTPIDVLIELSKDEDWKVRYNLAQNINCPSNILDDVLSKDENYRVREYVASNPNTSISTLVELYNNDKTIEVERSLASNSNIPKEILSELAKSNDRVNRQYVAYNKNTPIEVLVKLSKDEYSWVKSNVLDNPNVTKEIVTKLCEDKDDYISSKAMEKLATFEHNLKDTIEQASNYNVDESTNSNKHKHR